MSLVRLGMSLLSVHEVGVVCVEFSANDIDVAWFEFELYVHEVDVACFKF